jgi:hypothetical protein
LPFGHTPQIFTAHLLAQAFQEFALPLGGAPRAVLHGLKLSLITVRDGKGQAGAGKRKYRRGRLRETHDYLPPNYRRQGMLMEHFNVLVVCYP